ncbi:hypothetical protein CLF_111132 [Clonorchis sinensis]|uniref:Uncharacterized protein n=1 Tax=Clonorchis sinensis TaxID=79923 RepID=G7YUE8_CLOSI|nr:hypothetical protein CLF_111132 [Clonorchis sinensis]
MQSRQFTPSHTMPQIGRKERKETTGMKGHFFYCPQQNSTHCSLQSVDRYATTNCRHQKNNKELVETTRNQRTILFALMYDKYTLKR